MLNYSANTICDLEQRVYHPAMTLKYLSFQTPYLALDSEFYDLTLISPLDEPYLISFIPKAAALIDLDSKSGYDPDFT